jgi:hypothetical protein
MSIGYDIATGQGKVAYSDDGTRTLKEIKLYEISLVAIPANPKATVTSVKSLGDVQQILHSLRGATDPGIVAQLRQIDGELRRLLPGARIISADAIARSARLVTALAARIPTAQTQTAKRTSSTTPKSWRP